MENNDEIDRSMLGYHRMRFSFIYVGNYPPLVSSSSLPSSNTSSLHSVNGLDFIVIFDSGEAINTMPVPYTVTSNDTGNVPGPLRECGMPRV